MKSLEKGTTEDGKGVQESASASETVRLAATELQVLIFILDVSNSNKVQKLCTLLQPR